MDSSPANHLGEEIDELRSRVSRLEEALTRHGIALQEPFVEHRQASPVEALPSSTPERDAEVTPPKFGIAEPANAVENRSLESRIGSHWFNRIGILAMLIGMAWFLKLAIDNHWIGPLGRVLIGLLSGVGIIVWSERFHRRGYAGFAYSLKAVGSGALYLSLWAGFALYHLIPPTVAFAAMILVTAFNGFLSWLQDAELLAVYAVVGGFSTPLLVSTGENHEIALFSYLLLLDVAVLVLVALRPWSRLLFGAFTGTVLLFIGWWFEHYSNAQALRTSLFLASFFLIFAFAPRLIKIGPNSSRYSPRWNTLALILLPVANAGLGFLAFYAILQDSGADWAGPWLAIAFAAFYLLLLYLPALGILGENPVSLPPLHLTAVVVFLTIAIPLKVHGWWLTIGWLAEGAALFWAGTRIGSQLLRILALLCAILGLTLLVLNRPLASSTPIFNQRFGAFCVGIAAFSFIAWVASKVQTDERETNSLLRWQSVVMAASLVVNGLILLSIGWEIHNYWWNLRWHGDSHWMRDYRMYAQFTYSAFFMLFGAALLGIGFWRRSAFLRWQALLLIAVAIGKVFLVDVSELSQGYRIVSFMGLGALLLAVSFIYQRDWLNLRNGERGTNHEV